MFWIILKQSFFLHVDTFEMNGYRKEINEEETQHCSIELNDLSETDSEESHTKT